jgi:hypothetical protein
LENGSDPEIPKVGAAMSTSDNLLTRVGVALVAVAVTVTFAMAFVVLLGVEGLVQPNPVLHT